MATVYDLGAIAGEELRPALDGVTAGDEQAERLAGQIGSLVTLVNRASAGARQKAERLWADETVYPIGREKLVASIPTELRAGTDDALTEAELALDLLEGRHLVAVLRHDPRNDFALINEINNYAANPKSEEVVTSILGLARNPRYATLLAGPYGQSLAARFGFKPDALRKNALEALAEDGNDAQRRHSAALAAIPAARRVVALARAGRDTAAQDVLRPPAPAPSQGLMS